MKIEVKELSNQQGIINVAGQLDAFSAPTLRVRLKEAVTSGLVRLIVDLQAVTFIDSSGLSALVSGLKDTRQQNGNLALAGIQPEVRVALELTRLDRVFSIYSDVETALGEG